MRPKIATDLVWYFNVERFYDRDDRKWKRRTLSDFVNDYPEHSSSETFFQLRSICQRLVSRGLLEFRGYDVSPGHSVVGEAFVESYSSYIQLSDADASYGVCDFLIFGFPAIRDHFEQSVVALTVQDANGDHGIGTGFLVGRGDIFCNNDRGQA
jgi:hypothetical protein